MARYSLGQMLTFVFACCVYLAAIRGVLGLIVIGPKLHAASEASALWLENAAQIGAWLVLFALYCYWRLWITTMAHSVVFAVGVLDVLLGFSDAELLFGVVVGAAYSTLLSFPIAVVSISFRGLKKH